MTGLAITISRLVYSFHSLINLCRMIKRRTLSTYISRQNDEKGVWTGRVSFFFLGIDMYHAVLLKIALFLNRDSPIPITWIVSTKVHVELPLQVLRSEVRSPVCLFSAANSVGTSEASSVASYSSKLKVKIHPVLLVYSRIKRVSVTHLSWWKPIRGYPTANALPIVNSNGWNSQSWTPRVTLGGLSSTYFFEKFRSPDYMRLFCRGWQRNVQ